MCGCALLVRARRAEYKGHLVSGSLKLKDSIWRSDRVPFVMHFAGCQLCSGRTDSHYANWDECKDAMAQALTHVEDWSLAKLQLKHANLTSLEVVHADHPPTYPEETVADDPDAVATSADAAVEEEQLASLAPPTRP